MQISPAASTPPATQYHRRDGRIGRLPAAVACPPEVIIRLPGSRSYLAAGQDNSSLPPHYHSGKADRPGRSAIRPAPPLPRSWVPDISRGQLNGDEPDQPVTSGLEVMDHRLVLRVPGITTTTRLR